MADIFTKVVKSRKAATTGWGGARNRAVSVILTDKQVHGLVQAAARAIDADKAFNRFVTVHWGALGVSDDDAARATGRLIKLASDWCAVNRVRMTWAWVRENDAENVNKGPHVHILLHCPADLPIGRMWRRWLRRVTGGPYRRDGVYSRSVGPTVSTYLNNQSAYLPNLATVLDYMTKGALPRAIGGQVVGKRAAWWQKRRST